MTLISYLDNSCYQSPKLLHKYFNIQSTCIDTRETIIDMKYMFKKIIIKYGLRELTLILMFKIT